MNTALGGFLNALGMAFTGYGKDQQLAEAKRRQAIQDSIGDSDRLLALRDRGYVSPTSMASSVQAAQMPTDFGGVTLPANIGRVVQGLQAARQDTFKLPTSDGSSVNLIRDPEQTPEAKSMRLMNEREDRMSARDQQKQQAASTETERKRVAGEFAAFRELKAEFPKHPMARSSFDNAGGYGEALKDARAERTAVAGRTPQQKTQIVKDDKTGQYYRVRVDGPEGPVEATFPKTGGGGPGRVNNLNEAANTLRSATNDATEYENKVLGGEADFGASDQIKANIGFNQSAHPVLGPIAAKSLANNNPDFLRYRNSIIAVANAGMMLPGVRPSDVRQKKEELLAGLSAASNDPEAMRQMIQQVRQWRSDMLSGIEQTREQQGMTGPSKATPDAPRGRTITVNGKTFQVP